MGDNKWCLLIIKKLTIQRNWQHKEDEEKQNNTTQYVLDSTIRKQTQIT
jgi:hypothetical protein